MKRPLQVYLNDDKRKVANEDDCGFVAGKIYEEDNVAVLHKNQRFKKERRIRAGREKSRPSHQILKHRRRRPIGSLGVKEFSPTLQASLVRSLATSHT